MTTRDGVATKLALAEIEKKNLEAQLSALEARTAARIAALEEEVEALLSPQRTEAARSLYESRVLELTRAVEQARARREQLEQLLRPEGSTRSEIELARDASVLRVALEHEAEVGARLEEARSRLARVSTS